MMLHQQSNTFSPDMINNYIKAGPNTLNRNWNLHLQHKSGSPRARIYLAGNKVVDKNGKTPSYFNPSDQWSMVKKNEGYKGFRPARRNKPMDAQPIVPVTIHSAEQAKDLVLQQVGATRPKRDAVDKRITSDFYNGTGSMGISSSYPNHQAVNVYAIKEKDKDNDGLPDEWERARGLDPNDPRDSVKDRDGDGYLNIEDYINGPITPSPLPPKLSVQ